jgi:hypothetical protein
MSDWRTAFDVYATTREIAAELCVKARLAVEQAERLREEAAALRGPRRVRPLGLVNAPPPDAWPPRRHATPPRMTE